jgi:hypothetical protein
MTKKFKKILLTSGLISVMTTTALTGCKNKQSIFWNISENSEKNYSPDDLAVLTYEKNDGSLEVKIVSYDFGKNEEILLSGITENFLVKGIRNNDEEYDYEFIKENMNASNENISVDYTISNYFDGENKEITYDQIKDEENFLNFEKNDEEIDKIRNNNQLYTKNHYAIIIYENNGNKYSRVVQLTMFSTNEEHYASVTSPEIYVYLNEDGNTINCKAYNIDDKNYFDCQIIKGFIKENIITYDEAYALEEKYNYYLNDINEYNISSYLYNDIITLDKMNNSSKLTRKY